MDSSRDRKTIIDPWKEPEVKRNDDRLLESCDVEDVCESLGGNVELLNELCKKLRDWLALQPHLPQGVPDRRLEYFLVCTKLSLEQAKQKLDMHYTVRRLVPELFADRDPSGPGITQLRETYQYVSLPKLTPEKDRVSILKAIDPDVSKFQPWTFFKYTFMVGEIRISESRSLGEVYIYDLKGMRLGHLVKLTPMILKKCEVAATKAYGASIKGIHFVNAPSFIDRIVALLKSVMKPKLADRIHVHSGKYDSLYEYVPKSILPADYGGEQPTMNELSEMWRQKCDDWRDWFLAQQNVTVNEDLRPGKSVDGDELFGFSGSFRKLEFD